MTTLPLDALIISDEAQTAAAITAMAEEIERQADLATLAVVGIHTGGVLLAHRLLASWAARGKRPAATGTVDITLYRDDLEQIGPAPVIHATDITFDVAGLTVLLVDDVLFTGRTVRAAIDNLMDLGRPRRVMLAVLIDRGGRELPIRADVVGFSTSVREDEIVEVVFGETGDRVVRYRRPPRRL